MNRTLTVLLVLTLSLTLFLTLLAGCTVGGSDLATSTTTLPSQALPPPEPSQAPTSETPPARCPELSGTEALGRIENSDLTETSGIATSSLNPEAFWAHNDSGGEAALVAVGRDGSDLGTYPLADTMNRDWEDMARWTDPATGTNWLYVGDIGDNLAQWDSIFVHRVPEPAIGEVTPGTALGGVETFELTYPDGPHDAETLLVDPASGEITVLTKGDGTTSQVFVASGAVPGSATELTEAGTLDLSGTLDGQATAGDRIEGLVLIRTYTAVLAYPGDVDPWWEIEPCELDPPFEIQGEAIAIELDGSGYLTVAEGRRPRVNRSAFG